MPDRLLPLFLALALAGECAAETARVLTSVREIRNLSREELKLGHTARFEAVVLVHHPSQPYSVLFVHDGTEAIFLTTRALPAPLAPGTRVRISGKIGPGEFAPIILDAETAVIGHGAVPQPQKVTYDELLTGKEDSQWVQLSGVIRAVTLVEGQLRLLISVGTREVQVDVAGFCRAIPPDAPQLDAEVVIAGAAMTGVNPRGQVVNALMMAPSLDMIQVVRPAPPVEEIPEHPLHELLRFDPRGVTGHRVKVTGVVTHSAPGDAVYLTDGKTSLRANTRATTSFPPGSRVEALGFPEPGFAAPILAHSEFRLLEKEKPPLPARITSQQALSGDYAAALVTIDARLLGQTRQAAECDFVLESEGAAFRAKLSLPTRRSAPQVENGSFVRLAGIVVTEGELERREGPGFRPTAWHLLLRAPEDIAVLQRPPWWNKQRIMAALVVSGVVILGGVAWIAALRRRVEAQTAVIRQQSQREAVLEERNRIARELHDTLAQGFAGTAFALEGIVTQLEGDPHPLRPHIEMALGMVRHSLTEARRSVMNLRADALEQRNLAEALEDTARNLSDQYGVALRTDLAPLTTRLPPSLESNLFRIGVEAMTNALRHAKPRTLEVTMRCAEGVVTLRIRDDGSGFDPAKVPPNAGHFGVQGMRERAKQMNATLSLASSPEVGTEVRLTLPLPTGAAPEAEL